MHLIKYFFKKNAETYFTLFVASNSIDLNLIRVHWYSTDERKRRPKDVENIWLSTLTKASILVTSCTVFVYVYVGF
jgi:hypothetical protein